MGLFEFTVDKVIVTKELQEIAQFKKLLKGKDWENKIAYVYHMADYSSPYAVYPEEERKDKLREALLGGKAPSKELKDAIEVYKELSSTDAIKLLESARKATNTLRNYFENLTLDDAEDPGKEAKNLMSNLNAVGKLINSLKDWEEQVKKEKRSDQTRKGVRQTKYNVG